ncbi:MAG: hypothetical protein R2710_11345 [Acidimicrobiales bacterium]
MEDSPPVHRRRHRRQPLGVIMLAGLAAAGCVGAGADELTVAQATTAVTETVVATTEAATTTTTATTVETTTTTVETTTTTPPVPSDQRTLEKVADLTGDLSSKSVVASQTGLYIAQNMMYRHTISVFDADKSLVATVPDSVDLAAFGHDVPSGSYQGAPVEAAFGSTGQFAYVSNYRMYGQGFNADPGDSCNNDEGDPSYVYRLDLSKVADPSAVIDRAYLVGSVPKYVAVSPDDRLLLVTNWCTFDLSVIDLTTETTVATIELGRHPRGLAITSDSARAYVTVMGGSDIAIVDLATFELDWMKGVGQSPRHLVLSPDDTTLYATLNGEGRVIKIDLASRQVVDRVSTGIAPRSMAISADGTALYVVNYESNTMSKVRTSDFEILQNLDTAHHPIGITYDSFNDEVWVACYSGVIHVFADRAE